MTLSETELLKIDGGGVNTGLVISIGAAVAFLISVFEGFFNPSKCS